MALVIKSAYDIFPHAFRREELLFLWATAAGEDEELTEEESRGTC